jgi:hypothetical protein
LGADRRFGAAFEQRFASEALIIANVATRSASRKGTAAALVLQIRFWSVSWTTGSPQ